METNFKNICLASPKILIFSLFPQEMYFEPTFPVPGGPARRIALPAIFLDLISSTTTPAAYKTQRNLKLCNMNLNNAPILHYI